MNDRQQQVVASVVSGLLLVVVFLCPWRVESSDELRWSPIYQPPMSYVRSYDDTHGTLGSSRIESDEAHIAFGILALEIVALAVGGGVLYLFSRKSEETGESRNPPSPGDSGQA